MSLPEAIDVDQAPLILRAPRPSDNKYSRGVIALSTGSSTYPGAALLGVGAALATGVGMVRYLGPPEVSTLVLTTHPEVVVGPGRQDAAVVGSGFPRVSEQECQDRATALGGAPLPVVLDAGAMEHRALFPGPALLTPHRGELSHLAAFFGAPDGDPITQATWLAGRLNATMIVKGHDTAIISPSGGVTALVPAPAWLASAGTGDVLAGVLGAVLAQMAAGDGKSDLSETQCHDVAVVGCLIHLEAARRASHSASGALGKPLTASDLIDAIPEVVATLVARGEASGVS